MARVNSYIVTIHWPPRGRERYGHSYKYLVLATTEEMAVERVEERWAGKQGGADPHTTTVLGQVEGVHLFMLAELPKGFS